MNMIMMPISHRARGTLTLAEWSAVAMSEEALAMGLVAAPLALIRSSITPPLHSEAVSRTALPLAGVNSSAPELVGRSQSLPYPHLGWIGLPGVALEYDAEPTLERRIQIDTLAELKRLARTRNGTC